MFKRFLFLSLGLWLMVAAGANAAVGHCAVRDAAAAAPMSEHCAEMMGEMANDAPDEMPVDGPAALCCCAVMVASLTTDFAGETLTPPPAPRWAVPLPDRALLRAAVPEPPPPRL